MQAVEKMQAKKMAEGSNYSYKINMELNDDVHQNGGEMIGLSTTGIMVYQTTGTN